MSHERSSNRGQLLMEVRCNPRSFGRFLLLALLVVSLGVYVAFGAKIPWLVQIALGAPLLLLGTALLVSSLRRSLRVYEHGVSLRTLFRERWLPYEDVTEVHLRPLESMLSVYDPRCRPWELPLFRGPGCTIGSIGVFPVQEELLALYVALGRIVPVLGQKSLQSLREGATLSFGSVIATSDALEREGERLPWARIERLDLLPEGLSLFIRDRPGAAWVVPYDVPNVLVLRWLCERVPMLGPLRVELQATPRTAPPELPSPSQDIQTEQQDAPAAPVILKFSRTDSGPAGGQAARRVGGFPNTHPQLGSIVCGCPRPRRAMVCSLLFGAVYLCLLPLALAWPEAMLRSGWFWLAAILSGIVLVLASGKPHSEKLMLGSVAGAVCGCMFAVLVYGLWVGSQASMPIQYLTPGTCLGLALAGFATALMLRQEGFAIYEHGLQTVRDAIRWADCRHVTYSVADIAPGTQAGYRQVSLTLAGDNRQTAVRGRDAATEAHCRAIWDRVALLLVSRHLHELSKGGKFRVGTVELTRDTLTAGGRTLPLSRIRAVAPQLGWLHVWPIGEEQPFLSENLNSRDRRILLALLEHLLRPRR